MQEPGNIEEGRVSPKALAEYDQQLAAEGHLVLSQRRKRVGDNFVSIDQGQIPPGYLSFDLSVHSTDANEQRAHILVLDPSRFDHQVITGPEHVKPEEPDFFQRRKMLEEKQRTELERQGYIVYDQHIITAKGAGERTTRQHNLIGIKKKNSPTKPSGNKY
jgi:hypothetical protein